jgi:hypothetical protein
MKITPHRFRHFFISQQISHGFSVDEVADMVGISPAEIKKSSKHFVQAGRDRSRAKQSQIWMGMGLDENGNQPKGTVAIKLKGGAWLCAPIGNLQEQVCQRPVREWEPSKPLSPPPGSPAPSDFEYGGKTYYLCGWRVQLGS